jgi:hypothetical protein
MFYAPEGKRGYVALAARRGRQPVVPAMRCPHGVPEPSAPAFAELFSRRTDFRWRVLKHWMFQALAPVASC